MKSKEIGKYYTNKDNRVFKVIGKTEIKEYREGNPFSYPALVLEKLDSSRDGEGTVVVGSSQFNLFYKEFLWELPEDIDDKIKVAFEEFTKYYDQAMLGEYTKRDDNNSWTKYGMIEKISEVIAKSFMNLGYDTEENKGDDKFKREQTIEQLKSYSTYLLLHVDMISNIKKKEIDKNNS